MIAFIENLIDCAYVLIAFMLFVAIWATIEMIITNLPRRNR